MAVFRRWRLPWLSFRATSASSFFRFSSARRPPSPISWAFLLHVGDIPLDRFAGPVLPGPAAGRDLGFRIPSWVNCWTRRVVFPSSWAMAVELAHSGTVPVSTAGVVDLFGAVFSSFPPPAAPLFRRRPDGPAGFAFRLVVDFVFDLVSSGFFRASPLWGWVPPDCSGRRVNA